MRLGVIKIAEKPDASEGLVPLQCERPQVCTGWVAPDSDTKIALRTDPLDCRLPVAHKIGEAAL